jgi:secretion/DNA translocation related TadE-like protein
MQGLTPVRLTDWLRDDSGGATVWALATGLVTVVVAISVAAGGAATVARHRAQAAADLAALAGAAHSVEGQVVACERAAAIAAANGARLTDCQLEGWDLVVTAEVRPARVAAVAGDARASARAGPI